MRPLMIRADATAQTGAGHGMRCLTLAETWLSEGRGPVKIAGRIDIPFVAERASAIGVQRVADGVLPDAADILVVDSYDDRVRNRCSSSPARMRVLVDDIGCSVPAGYDVLWNPNAYGADVSYGGFDGVRLAGAEFIPVRSGLPAWKPTPESGTLATLGSSDLDADVRDAFEFVARSFADTNFSASGEQLSGDWKRIASADLWAYAAKCERAVIGAGVTAWEFASVGTPVVLVVLADNQSLIGGWAARAGVPVVDCRGGGSSRIANELADALGRARPMPRISDGAARVAAGLSAAAERVAA